MSPHTSTSMTFKPAAADGSFVGSSSGGSSTPRRRSARFAPASPSPPPPPSGRRSPARLNGHVATQSPRRSLRITPPGTDADAREQDTGGRKRKSPDLHEDGIKKRLRVRCPAEPQPTPTRKGKAKAPSPSSPDEASKRIRAKPTGQDSPRRPRVRTRSVDASPNARTSSSPTPGPVRVTRSSAALNKMISPSSPTTTNPLTLRSPTKGVRGRREGSPAPGRLDEIDMGVVNVSPSGPPPSLRLQIPIKKEPSSGTSPSSPCAPSSPIGVVDVDGDCASHDVDMPLAPLDPDSNISAEPPSLCESSTTSAPRDTRMRTRSLSPDDFAPSPFAQPAGAIWTPASTSPALSASPSPTTDLATTSTSPSVSPSTSSPPATYVPPSSIPTSPLSSTGEGVLTPLPTDTDVDMGALGLPSHAQVSLSPVVVSPDWPLPHAPFSLSSPSPSSSSSSPPSSHFGPPPAPSYSVDNTMGGSAADGDGYGERHTRALEWAALLQRRRRAGERALAEAGAAAASSLASSPPSTGPSSSISSPALGGFEEPVYEERTTRVGPGSPLRLRVDVPVEGEDGDDVDVGMGEGEGTITLLPPPGLYEQQPQTQPEGDASSSMGTGTGTGMSVVPQDSATTGPSAGWGLWKIACRVRVWEVRNRYPPGLIRALVAQEADDYFTARGIAHPDSLLFMEEEYYDWELDSEGEGDGDGEEDVDGDADGDVDAHEEADGQGEFVLQPPPTPPSPGADGEASPGMGMGGVQSSFYATPAFPPPPLASVRVPMLRHFFTDIAIAPLGGGRGTPVDRARQAAWGGGVVLGDLDGRAAGLGTGTLERRLPHPRARPHPMYLAMPRDGYDGSERALSSASAAIREERREEAPMPEGVGFNPDEAVWQEFLKSVGVEGSAAAATSVPSAPAPDAMDVDAPSAQIENGLGGTSSGISLGLSCSPHTHNSDIPPASAAGPSSARGMGVEMGIGMFGMAMGMGWFGGPTTSGPVAVGGAGDGGDRERERESSLSFALGV